AASVEIAGDGTVAALAAVNAFGDVVDPDTGRLLAGPGLARRDFRTASALISDPLAESPLAASHTTLVCVAATVPFDTGALKRVATEARAGLARAVRRPPPIGAGAVCFALAPGGAAPPLLTRLRVGAAAAEAAARAIAAAVA